MEKFYWKFSVLHCTDPKFKPGKVSVLFFLMTVLIKELFSKEIVNIQE